MTEEKCDSRGHRCGRLHRRGHSAKIRARGLHRVRRPAQRRQAGAAGGRYRKGQLEKSGPLARCPQEADIAVFLGKRIATPARRLHLQHWCQVASRPSTRPSASPARSGKWPAIWAFSPAVRPQPDAATRPGRDLLYRGDRQPARRHRLCRLRLGQGRPAGGGASRRARARAAKRPRRPSGDRLGRRHGLGPRAHQGARRRRGARQPGAGPADAAGSRRRGLLGALQPAARCLGSEMEIRPFGEKW